MPKPCFASNHAWRATIDRRFWYCVLCKATWTCPTGQHRPPDQAAPGRCPFHLPLKPDTITTTNTSTHSPQESNEP